MTPRSFWKHGFHWMRRASDSIIFKVRIISVRNARSERQKFSISTHIPNLGLVGQVIRIWKVTPKYNNYMHINRMRTLREQETYKYLGILEVNTLKHTEMKKNSKRIPRKTRILETKLRCRNLIKVINTSAFLLRQILGTIIKVDER